MVSASHSAARLPLLAAHGPALRAAHTKVVRLMLPHPHYPLPLRAPPPPHVALHSPALLLAPAVTERAVNVGPHSIFRLIVQVFNVQDVGPSASATYQQGMTLSFQFIRSFDLLASRVDLFAHG
eukprot:5143697-Amphidinium_carterae.1